MLNIFYGRDNLDKEKFIYEEIDRSGRESLVIVPDQYTLEAEKQAFRYLKRDALMDVEIISVSRLGYKLLEELGGGHRDFLDKYGRHMLLSSIARKNRDNIEVFRDSVQKTSFIETVNNFISELKQYDTGVDQLDDIIKKLPEDSLCRKKMEDLRLLYSEYEKAIDGKYTDSEDYIDLYIDKISQSQFIKGKDIWVFGFDSFAPKTMDVLRELMCFASSVNVCLTYADKGRDSSLFTLTGILIDKLQLAAAEKGIEISKKEIDSAYAYTEKAPAIRHLEKELFAVSKKSSNDNEGITLVSAANMYYEAESAASFILTLIRDKGYRYRDIVVICNDQKLRGSIISRVFGEYGIRFFADKKRDIINSPVAVFLMSLLQTVDGGYRTGDIIRTLKTGLSPLKDEDVEVLENYTRKYRIKGNMWKKTFGKGEVEYGTAGLDDMNFFRDMVLEMFAPVEEHWKKNETVGEFIPWFYDYVTEQLKLTEKIQSLMDEQKECGLPDIAEETAQIWSYIVNLMDQTVNIVGSEKVKDSGLTDLLIAGLDEVKIGILPPSSDDILMGTMQRTRCGNAKAIIVLGANEGVLPASGKGGGLFAPGELDILSDLDVEICKVDSVKIMEEKLAIYRNMVKPTEHLWLGYSVSDDSGEGIRPSEIILDLKKIFPELATKKDVVNGENSLDLIGGEINTLRHLTQILTEHQRGGEISDTWKQVAAWYEENRPEMIGKVKRELSFHNDPPNLPADITKDLFYRENGELRVSPSRLEKFSRCQFAHFVAYGLRPEELRVYEASARELGDIYHQCIMEFSDEMTESARWETISDDECRDIVKERIHEIQGTYREGLFHFSNEEKYKATRMEDACFLACRKLVEQVRVGKIKDSKYEVSFGGGRDIKPIQVTTKQGSAYITGTIDRLDVLAGDRIKIIDYKSGKNTFDETEVRSGYALQLMVYLKAAQEDQYEPAGVFYFRIGEPEADVSGLTEDEYNDRISRVMRENYLLNGAMVSDQEVATQIGGELDSDEKSPVIEVSLKNGCLKGKKTLGLNLFTEEEFGELQEEVDMKIQELCSDLTSGKIKIHPKKVKDKTPCTYCSYKGICRFDAGFSGCTYDIIK